jgi:YesN/AraC family two-component response regulator
MPESGAGDRPKVLAIEDDFGVRESFKLILDEDFDVLEAVNGADGLRICQDHAVDVILLDLMLPDLDGLEVLRRLRPRHPGVPIVVVTGVAVLKTAVEAMRLGAADFLTKPFEESELLDAINRARRSRRGERREPAADSSARAGGWSHPYFAVVGGDLACRATVATLLRGVGAVEYFPRLSGAVPHRDISAAVIFLEGTGTEDSESIRELREAAPGVSLYLVVRDPAAHSSRAGEALFRTDEIGALIRAVRLQQACHQRPLSAHVANAITHIARHHDAALCVGNIATEIGISESRLAHLFPEETGMTVRRFLSLLRIEIAKDLLAKTDDKVDVVARQVGFSGRSYLSRALSRHTGRPATAYRTDGHLT